MTPKRHAAMRRTLSGLCLTAAATLGACKPHEHGVVRLDVGVDGSRLSVAMTAALDNWLGFERAPRSDAERKAAAEVLARLRNPTQGAPLFTADAGAQCKLSKAEVSAPVLEAPSGTTPKPPTGSGHADLEALYEFQCAQPAALKSLEIGLFDAYKRIQRIHVQVAGAQGQVKVTLKRPARSVPLVR